MSEKENPKAEDDQGFNDDELQDIMNEIENLEKEFVEEAVEEVVAEPAAKVVEAEEVVEAAPEVVEAEPVVTEAEPVSNVVSMDKASESSGSQMDFAGSGTMDFNLTFNIAGEPAHLNIDGDSGFTLNMEGVHFSISEEGCTVEMKGGVKFEVPWDNSKVSKKAS